MNDAVSVSSWARPTVGSVGAVGASGARSRLIVVASSSSALRQAVRTWAMAATSTTVTSAGLVLAGTFAVFAIAGAGAAGGEITEVGAGIALGVLMDTFLVRTVLVQATVVLLGRWNWWPATLSRKDRELPPQPEPEPVTAGAR